MSPSDHQPDASQARQRELEMQNADLRRALAEQAARMAERAEEMTRAEAEVAAHRDRLLSLADTIPAHIAYVNAETLKYEFVNGLFAAAFGFPRAHVIGRHVREIIGESRYRFAREHIDEAKRGRSISFENSFELPSGKRWFQINYTPVVGASGTVQSITVLSYDITERKRTEEALRGRDAILDAARFAGERFLGVSDWRAAIEDVLTRFGEATQVSRVVVFEVVPAPDGEVLLNWRHEWAAAGIERRDGAKDLQNMPLRAMGFARWIDELSDGRAIYGLVGDLPAAEQQGLAVQGIQSVAAVPIFVGGRWWGFIGFDHCATASAWGEEQIDALRLAARILGETIQRQQSEMARMQLEVQFQQAQKLESVGRLAGGVAHDFNNMLAVILGRTELALAELESSHPLRSGLLAIEKAAKHSADLTAQLLAFASRQTTAPRVVNLNDAIAATLKMLHRLIGEDIALVWVPDARLWAVQIDPTQVDQMLANLCVNARDAIAGVGTLTIQTCNTAVDIPAAGRPRGGAPGEYVVITVSDTGSGMSQNVLERIFEPFFTTKELGRGTGLGLATVYGIVKQNGGFVTVSSELGHGTTFRIHLPRFVGEIVEALPPAEAAAPTARGETILVVEDEPAILELTTEVLERQGYTVLPAGTPEEALRLVREHAGAIDLLLTDVVMPSMNGQDLVTRVVAVRPLVKSLFMSGYTADIFAERGIPEAGVQFIQKPFNRHGLAAKVRQVLDTPSDTPS